MVLSNDKLESKFLELYCHIELIAILQLFKSSYFHQISIEFDFASLVLIFELGYAHPMQSLIKGGFCHLNFPLHIISLKKIKVKLTKERYKNIIGMKGRSEGKFV